MPRKEAAIVRPAASEGTSPKTVDPLPLIAAPNAPADARADFAAW